MTNKVAKYEQPAYDLIESELKSWKQELDNPDSEANMYGLTMVDVVYCICRKLREANLG